MSLLSRRCSFLPISVILSQMSSDVNWCQLMTSLKGWITSIDNHSSNFGIVYRYVPSQFLSTYLILCHGMSCSVIRCQLMSSHNVSQKAELLQWMFLLVISKHFINVSDVIRCHLISLDEIKCHLVSIKVGWYCNFYTFWRLTSLLTYTCNS